MSSQGRWPWGKPVGESFFVPLPEGKTLGQLQQQLASAAIRRRQDTGECYRTNRRREPEPGLTVTRVK